jgi:hypothetical protein
VQGNACAHAFGLNFLPFRAIAAVPGLLWLQNRAASLSRQFLLLQSMLGVARSAGGSAWCLQDLMHGVEVH